MKKIITLVLCFFSLLASAQEDDYSFSTYHPDGNVKTFLHHKSGSYAEFFDNSQRKVMGNYEGGKVVANTDKMIGEWVYFNKEGDLLKIYHYQCDKISSKFTFDDSCRVKSAKWIEYFPETKTIRNKGTLKDYKKEGKWEKYYNTGELRQVLNYKNDIRHGASFYYYNNGNLANKTNYKDGLEVGDYEMYDQTTKNLIEKTYMLNGKFNGSYIENYPNGKVKEKGNYIKGDRTSEWHYYFENGKVKMTGAYLNNKRTDVWKRYDEKGNLRAEISFKASERDGKSVFYNEDGSIDEIKLYKNDKQIE